ncbi:hypothetical protein AN634_04180 [Lactiplantibacillus plantarum]|nr:hypothetical protein AN634_04180 [Lactiplantibacillus plantarum]
MLNQQREQMHARLMPQATYGVELSQPLGEVVERSDKQIANEISKLTDYRTAEERQPDTPQMAMYRRLMEAKADREEAD